MDKRLVEDQQTSTYAALLTLSESLEAKDIIVATRRTDDSFVACIEHGRVPVTCGTGVSKICPLGVALVELTKKLKVVRRLV